MHPVLGKMKFNAFDGMFDIHGTERDIAFVPASDGELSVLAIRGLAIEDALHVLSVLNGGLLKGKDAEQLPLPLTKSAPVPPKPAPAKAEAKQATKPPPAPVKVVAASAPESDVDEEVDDEEEDEDVGEVPSLIEDIDIKAMAKMEKLRPVIEHLVALGFKSAAAITSISETIKSDVPALLEVDKKGDFDKRMERAAMVVLSGK